jgi:hypothetical protein
MKLVTLISGDHVWSYTVLDGDWQAFSDSFDAETELHGLLYADNDFINLAHVAIVRVKDIADDEAYSKPVDFWVSL